MKHKKTIVLVLFFLFSSVLTVTVQSTGLFDDDSVVFNCDNENYTMNPIVASSVNSVYVSDSWIRFNNTDFNVTSSNPINLTVLYLNDDIAAASSGDTVLSFDADSTGGLVYFNLSGFKSNQDYMLYVDGVYDEVVASDGSGIIHFTHNTWSDHSFLLKDGEMSPEEEGFNVNLLVLLSLSLLPLSLLIALFKSGSVELTLLLLTVVGIVVVIITLGMLLGL